MGRLRRALSRAFALGVATVVVGSFLLLSTIATPVGAVHLSPGIPGPPPAARSAPAPNVARAPDAAPLTPPTAGEVLDTVVAGLNASFVGNIAYRTADWAVGEPVVLSPPVVPKEVVWYPTYPQHTSPYPRPSTAPVLEFSPETTTVNGTPVPPGFFGVIPSLTNTSALAFDPVNGYVYATEPLNNSVAVFDPTTMAWAHPSIPVGTFPSAIVYDPQNETLFVANEGSDNVTVINATTNAVAVAGIPVGRGPIGLTFDAYDSQIFVVNANSNNLTVIDSNAYFESMIILAGAASGVAYSNETGAILVTIPTNHLGFLYNATTLAATGFANTGTGATSVVPIWDGWGFLVTDNHTNTFSTFNSTVGGLAVNATLPTGIDPTASALVSDDTGNALIWNNFSRSVTLVNLALNRVVSNNTGHDIWPGPAGLAYSPSTNQLFVANVRDGSISAVNPLTLRTSTTMPNPIPGGLIGGPPLTLTLNDSAHLLYVGAAGAVSAISYAPSTPVLKYVYLTTGTNIALAFDSVTNRLWVLDNRTGLIGLYANNLTLAATVGLANVSESTLSAIALDPANNALFVVNHTSDIVSVVDASTGQILVPSIANAGANDTSAVYDPADGSVYVLGNEVTIINATTDVAYATPVILPYHYVSWGISYDPSREYVYALTTFGIPALAANLTAIDGSSVNASYGSTGFIPVGQFPVQALPIAVPTPGYSTLDEIWVSNYESGTLSVVGSPPEITSFTATPNPVRIGQPLGLTPSVVDGSGPLVITEFLVAGGNSSCSYSNFVEIGCTLTSTGTFTFTIGLQDALGGPVTSASVNVTAYAGLALSATIDGSNLRAPPLAPSHWNIDPGRSVYLNATASLGVAPYQYLWTSNGFPVASTDDTVWASGFPGTYVLSVTVNDSAQESAVESVVITVAPAPTVSLSATPSTVDVGQVVTLTATVAGGVGVLAENWLFQGGVTGATGPTAEVSWTTAGIWNVSFAFEDLDHDFANATVQVHVDPSLGGKASYAYNGSSTATPIVGYPVQFTASPTGGDGVYAVSWSFGDGSNASGDLATHSFASPGNYTVRFTISDSTGATVNGSMPIEVLAAPVKTAPPPSSSSSSSSTSSLEEGLILGLIVGAAVAACIVGLADRSRRKSRPPPPPSPYVPPAAVEPVHPWKED